MILSQPKCPAKPPAYNFKTKDSLSEVGGTHNSTPLKRYSSLIRKSAYVELELFKDSL